MITDEKKSSDSYRLGVIILAIVISGCTLISTQKADPEVGSSKADVLAILGEPDVIQDFIITESPLFGPHEVMVNRFPAGTVLEEWTYEIGDEKVIVWFFGEDNEGRDSWRVVGVTRFPKDAIF